MRIRVANRKYFSLNFAIGKCHAVCGTVHGELQKWLGQGGAGVFLQHLLTLPSSHVKRCGDGRFVIVFSANCNSPWTGQAAQAMISFTTRPATSVSRNWRPWKR
jgi:hypothetical protein